MIINNVTIFLQKKIKLQLRSPAIRRIFANRVINVSYVSGMNGLIENSYLNGST